MAIGIMSAMREEISCLMGQIDLQERVVKGMRTYLKGHLWGKEVVLVFSRWGKVASATTATHLINNFNVSEILFTGVAGAVDSAIEIGDVVIGRDLYQHDMDASPLVAPYSIPLLNKSSFRTDGRRNGLLRAAVDRFLQEKEMHVDPEKLRDFDITEPKGHEGSIASGDQFISDPEAIRRIRTGLPQVLCVEMEGAAVAQVCFEYKIPFNIIRTISDKANDNSHVDFPAFAAEVASPYARGIIRNYFETF